jgi:hypothetical protein
MFNASLLENTIGCVPRFNGAWNADAVFAIFAPVLMRTFALPIKRIAVLL